MAITTRGVPVEVVEDDVPVPLTRERLAADVLAAAGGVAALRGPGLPSGGAPGAVLLKNSGADYDVGWWSGLPASYYVGWARHGSSASVERPPGYGLVIWIGEVPPANAERGDVWLARA